MGEVGWAGGGGGGGGRARVIHQRRDTVMRGGDTRGPALCNISPPVYSFLTPSCWSVFKEVSAAAMVLVLVVMVMVVVVVVVHYLLCWSWVAIVVVVMVVLVAGVLAVVGGGWFLALTV
ncbi:hypothetical protein E2C01_043587 [Portunus trituberculatus]|uniref:Transmembrane protein n=1 Tax=Portunus trituberculatus TaxID=210409 RepID=A0A5B7FXQ5_PORTR|nr:hypothetical protein [Portunus trituberculatus]